MPDGSRHRRHAEAIDIEAALDHGVDLVGEKAVRFAVDRSRRLGVGRLDKAEDLAVGGSAQDRVTGGLIWGDRAA